MSTYAQRDVPRVSNKIQGVALRLLSDVGLNNPSFAQLSPQAQLCFIQDIIKSNDTVVTAFLQDMQKAYGSSALQSACCVALFIEASDSFAACEYAIETFLAQIDLAVINAQVLLAQAAPEHTLKESITIINQALLRLNGRQAQEARYTGTARSLHAFISNTRDSALPPAAESFFSANAGKRSVADCKPLSLFAALVFERLGYSVDIVHCQRVAGTALGGHMFIAVSGTDVDTATVGSWERIPPPYILKRILSPEMVVADFMRDAVGATANLELLHTAYALDPQNIAVADALYHAEYKQDNLSTKMLPILQSLISYIETVDLKTATLEQQQIYEAYLGKYSAEYAAIADWLAQN